ncbi:IclR family transcriptional regulator (plasmid) [Mesorhizobium sp. ORM8.1]
MPDQHLKMIDKALNLLDLFETPGHLISIGEAVEALKVPRSSLYRLVATLESRHLLQRVDEGLYSLGPWFNSRIQYDVLNPLLRLQTSPILQKISEQADETALLGLRSGVSVIYVDRCETAHALKALSDLGKPFPIYAGCTGRCILACLPQDEILKILDRKKLRRVTNNTISDRNQLMKELSMISRRGYGVSHGEIYSGIHGVAIPIRDADGAPLGAISIEAPGDRFHAKKIPLFVNVLRSFEADFARILKRSNP